MSFRRSDQLQSYDYEEITVSNSAVKLTPAKYLVSPPCKEVEIFVDTASIRHRKDGTAPTSSVGDPLNPYDRLTLDNMNDAANVQFIRSGSSDGKLRVHYRR